MKKLLSLLLTVLLAFSLVACGAKAETKNDGEKSKQTAADAEDSSFKAKEVAKFADILDNQGNKDYFYVDSAVIKINEKEAMKAFNGKVSAITKKAMTDKSIDMKNVKEYTYYKNVNGTKSVKAFEVVYDASSKEAKECYEVVMTVSDKDEPTLKEVKKLDKIVDAKFKELFKAELEKKAK